MNLEPLLEAVPAAVVDPGYGPVSVDVPAADWLLALTVLRDEVGCSFFDFLTAVDDPDGVRVVCHVAALSKMAPLSHVIVRTLLPSVDPSLVSVASLYLGALWHERETAEMFGVRFTSPAGEVLALEPLLLPPGVRGYPLRKSFSLTAREERAESGEAGE